MVSAWPEPPSAKPTEPSADVCDGQEALALCISKTPPVGRRRADQSDMIGYGSAVDSDVEFSCVLVGRTSWLEGRH
jgi:hypothetical protein